MRRDQHDKIDWYLASVAQTIAAVNGNKTKIHDFLLKFESPQERTPQDSQAMWCSIFGIDPEQA